jgi:hypothetical protein
LDADLWPWKTSIITDKSQAKRTLPQLNEEGGPSLPIIKEIKMNDKKHQSELQEVVIDYEIQAPTEDLTATGTRTTQIPRCPTGHREESNAHGLNRQDQFKNFERTIKSLFQATCAVSILDICRYQQDSIVHTDPLEKSICRVIDIFKKTVKIKSDPSLLSGTDLFRIVNHIDMTTRRDYLYEPRLKEECHFLIPEEIVADAPWEDIFKPLKQYKANFQSGYFTNQWIFTGLMIFTINIIDQRLKATPWRYDLSQLVRNLAFCTHHEVEALFLSAMQKFAPGSHLLKNEMGSINAKGETAC